MSKTKKTTKYNSLCEAYQFGIEECDLYRKECREFVHDMKNHIMESLNCPETKIFMFSPSGNFVFNSQTLQGDALDTEFGENGMAAIGFAINVNGEHLEERFFTFILMFKKVDGEFVFNVDDNKDFKNEHEDICKFCDYLYEIAHKNLTNRLKNFLQSPDAENKPIGFRLNQ
jgi:hypothetical protein